MNQQRNIVIRGLFGLLSMIAAAAAGYYAYDRTSSWWLVAFAVVMSLFVFGRAIPDLITDTEKGRRAIFFGTPLVFAVGSLAVAHALWSTWWLSVVLGFVIGGVGWMVVTMALPDIAQQEQQDSSERFGAGVSQTATRPQQGPILDPQLATVLRAAREAGITFTPAEEQAILRAHAVGNDEEVARLIESKLPKVPAGV